MYFPRISRLVRLDVAGILRSFGIVKLFDESACDLTSLMERESMERGNAYCYKIQHVTDLTVDRKGIEGAAVTVAAGGAESAEMYETVRGEFVVDRPFGFILTDTYGTSLFRARCTASEAAAKTSEKNGEQKRLPVFCAERAAQKRRPRFTEQKKLWYNVGKYFTKKGAMDLQAREKIEYALEQIRKGQDEGVETLYVLMGRTMLFVANGVVRTGTRQRTLCRALFACGTRATYTAESLFQFSLLCRLAAESGSRLPVLLRLSCGNQFGMDERTLCSLLERKNLPVEIEGVQYYSGTQKRIEAVRREVQMLQELCRNFPASAA